MFVTDRTHTTGAETADRPVSRATQGERGVLVVDDIPAIRQVLDAVLRSRGCRVWQAADGHEAETVFRAHAERIGLILMDVRMPRVDGPQALRAIRLLSPHVRCWFMSGDLGGYTQADLIACGAERVLAKPFRVTEVSALVEGVFDGTRASEMDHLDRWDDDGGASRAEPTTVCTPTRLHPAHSAGGG